MADILACNRTNSGLSSWQVPVIKMKSVPSFSWISLASFALHFYGMGLSYTTNFTNVLSILLASVFVILLIYIFSVTSLLHL
jgi:hypothetical protein